MRFGQKIWESNENRTTLKSDLRSVLNGLDIDYKKYMSSEAPAELIKLKINKFEKVRQEYVKNILEPILRNKGRKGLKGKNEFTKLTPTMIENEMIPISYNIYGEPYIEKQNNIANKYKIMVMIKVKLKRG